MIILTLLLPLLTSSCNAANILAIMPMPSYSHQIAYSHIWRELSIRGHKVTVLTTDPLKDPKLTNLTEIDLHDSYDSMSSFMKNAQMAFTMWNMHQLTHILLTQIADKQLSHPKVQNLIQNKSSFDVVLVEFLYPEYLAFAEIYDCPKIVISSLDGTGIFHHLMGNPNNPILYPEIGAHFYAPLSFKERVISTVYTWYSLNFYFHISFTGKDDLVRKYFNIPKTVQEMVDDIDMMFINVNPILQPIRALGPTTITIGGSRNMTSSEDLPQDLAEFLDSAVNGFIYFSLGSNVKSKELDKDSLEAITETLRELPYKVLWKFEADELPNKPQNVKIIKWAPQLSILSHPNIILFITQGGLQSMEESFYNEVPTVVIPFFGDQGHNARLMVSKGITVSVNRLPSLNKVEFKNAILEVTNNPKYRNNVKRLKKLALDFPMSGLDKAIWWTEYVIRNKGAKHLRNPAADLPFYQYYLIDVISFLVFSLASSLTLLYLIIRTIYRYTKLHIHRSNYKPPTMKKIQ